VTPPHALCSWLTIISLCAPCTVVLADSPRGVVPPTVIVAGQSQGLWSQRWWEWASSFSYETSPIADRTGARCGAGQSGAVWFLAGTYGSNLVQRKCTVPKGKYLFFPLINYVVTPKPGRHPTCFDVTTEAQLFTDNPSVLVAEIDGIRIPNLETYRQVSPGCFDLAVNTSLGISVSPAAANGYFLMLPPLMPGLHSLHFGGELSTLKQAISYEITVK
jgi:hypothetical protein